MCGIVAGVSYRNIVPILTEGLRRMEYRGYDSCGVAVVDDGQLQVHLGTVGRLGAIHVLPDPMICVSRHALMEVGR